MAHREVTSFCRICTAFCGVRLTIDDDGCIVAARGDKAQPMGKGYVCFKGVQAEESHHGPARLLKPLKRMSDGSFAPIAMETALREIAERTADILRRRGGSSVGIFAGSGSIHNAVVQPVHRAFLAAIGSEQFFSPFSIDQPAKYVSSGRLGGWMAGLQDLDHSDVVMLFGTNPLLSHMTLGLMGPDPMRRLKRVKARGLKIICIDPRRSETARHADLFLQPRPGFDAAIAAALCRIILAEGWEDREFCAAHVGGDRISALRAAVEPFTAEVIERHAGLEPEQLREAAALFARDNRRGAAFAGTGSSMAPFANLAQHLVDCLNVICGRFRRAGDVVPVNPLEPPQPIYAEVVPPHRSWESAPPGRVRGAGLLAGEKLSATLAEEITTPGESQIRCLFVDGGNAANCIPDQARIVDALRSLELLVVIDPCMTVTAQLAHYVLPPPMMYERPDLPLSFPGVALYPDSWVQYTPAHLEPPAGAELIEEWRFYWEIASRLGRTIVYDGKVALDGTTPPTSDELLAIRMSDAAISLDELKRHPSGVVCHFPFARVVPGRPEATARFDVMPPDVATECSQLLAGLAAAGASPANDSPPTLLLASRRLRETFNSIGTALDSTLRRRPFNPAYLAPEDLTALGLRAGDQVRISSRYGSVAAVVCADPDLRRGVVSLPHGWGGHPGASEAPGSPVNFLINCQEVFEPITAMPRMSAIPVTVRHVREPAGHTGDGPRVA